MKLKKTCAALMSAVVALCFAPGVCAGAQESESPALKDIHAGWREYQYRSFDFAARLFTEAFRKAASKEDKLQALTGQAFCLQFGTRASATPDDFENAIAIYRQCIEIASGDQKLLPFFNAMIAECYYREWVLNGDDAKRKSADGIWAELQAARPDSLAAQDALLFKAISETKSFDGSSNAGRMDEMARRVEKAPAPGPDSADANALTQVMANYIAMASFWEGDCNTAVRWLKSYLALGPTSYSQKNITIFKIARISDVKLNDKRTAVEYYMRFNKEFPINVKSYFSKVRAAELSEELSKEGK